MRVFPFFNVVRLGQLSSTHFKYFTSFFRAVPDVQLSIMFIFKSSIARQRINIRHYVYCLAVLRTINCPVCICAGVSLLQVQFYLRFLYMRFPHWRCLHADSTTRAIHMMYFTRYFHYLRNPYPQNDHYPQFHYTRIKSPQFNPSSHPAAQFVSFEQSFINTWKGKCCPNFRYNGDGF